MSQIERQNTVLNILRNLRDMDGLKKLFWEELNYTRENKPLSIRGWPDSVRNALDEDPVLFATGGEDGAFHVIYCKLSSDVLLRGLQRPVVNLLLREHPYALFVFSDTHQTHWHFLNVKYDATVEKRRLFRRITIGPGHGLRTATERIQMLDLEALGGDLFGLYALTIQSRHDDAFDVEKVTKDFYREIANWYFWALKHIQFPKDAPKEADGRDHVGVIRLITRLIFCWFVKEKGLISEALFDRRELGRILVGFEPVNTSNDESVFYRAILQNLFFATLNTEMDKRGWARDDQNFMAHSLYRFKESFSDPDATLELFRNIPFLNGGLFECLDKDRGEGTVFRYLRIDGFSRRMDSRVTAPDFLFFGPEQEVDLSEDYNDKKFRKVNVRGLIETLNHYKFTIEENTPFDQEVALDPELCGKVFENLLAAYNPETGTTARKATGSFYTPREIVDYMVDEALIAYLKDNNDDIYEKKLRFLFSWEENEHGFSEDEVAVLINRIDSLKALDPAVGSGAFPMGILHKLVFILCKLDPDNQRWKAKQIAKLDDVVMRDEAERIFRDNYDDYGRKLYLIENCIYGVDIQPIAVQIAKMRFFISLIVDQKVDVNAQNLGVRALPNLETKFVAANSLIGIEKPSQMMLRNPNIDQKEAELRDVREKHFNAKTPTSKAKWREQDKKLRIEIAELLKSDGWGDKTAKQLAAWDPYNQNTFADFFDAEWMFGVREGFDVVIGNPPYLVLSSDYPNLDLFTSRFYVSHGGKKNLYKLFFERGINLLRSQGVLSFISPINYLTSADSLNLRDLLSKKTYIHEIVEYSEKDKVFDAVTQAVCTIVVKKAKTKNNNISYIKNGIRFRINQEDVASSPQHFIKHISPTIEKIELQSYKLDDFIIGFQGEVNVSTKKEHFMHTLKSSKCRPLVRGNQIKRYYTVDFPEEYCPVDVQAREHYAQERIVLQEVCNAGLERRVNGTLMKNVLCGHTTNYLISRSAKVSNKLLLALINSRLVNYYFKFYNQTNHVPIGEVKRIPVPDLSTVKQISIVNLVDNILAAKVADPAADTSALEQEIDKVVYQLYGLTDEEIVIVEGYK